jgi:glycosyltransferase involved in cell wall biosynthesis
VRILLVAPTVNSGDVGEAWVAYQWADLLSQRFDVTLLTYRKRGAPSITEQVPRARVVEWLEPRGLGRFERFNSLLKPGYVAFDLHARKWIKDAARRGEHFDVAHQVVPVAMRYPSPLRVSSVPYIIGPVGGSLDSPPGFRGIDSGPWYQRLRALDGLRIRHDVSLRRSYERAAVVLGIADYVHDFLSHLTLHRFEVLSETGLVAMPAADPPQVPATFSDAEPLRLLFVGRVIRTKGARDLVAAMAHLRDVPVELDVVGDGFDATACRELADDLGVAARVRFHGWASKEAVQGFYRESHVFAFPSYREPGGNVVFEAMGHHLPLIVCDRGGPGAAVDSTCAFTLEAHDPDQLARDIASAVRRFVADPSLVTTMGAAARARLETVGLWSAKIDRIATLYDEVARDRRI